MVLGRDTKTKATANKNTDHRTMLRLTEYRGIEFAQNLTRWFPDLNLRSLSLCLALRLCTITKRCVRVLLLLRNMMKISQ